MEHQLGAELDHFRTFQRIHQFTAPVFQRRHSGSRQLSEGEGEGSVPEDIKEDFVDVANSAYVMEKA